MKFLIHQARICPIFLTSDTSPPQNLPHQVTNREGKICQIAWFVRKDIFCNLDFRLAPSAQKGLSATEQNTLVCFGVFLNIPSHKILIGPCLIYSTHCFLFPQIFMVMEGEVTVVLNTTQFLVRNCLFLKTNTVKFCMTRIILLIHFHTDCHRFCSLFSSSFSS